MDVLSNEEKAKVLSMYPHCIKTDGLFVMYLGHNVDFTRAMFFDKQTAVHDWCDFNELVCYATSLSAITDEDAIVVGYLIFLNEKGSVQPKTMVQWVNHTINSKEINDRITSFADQYLKYKGYAVPLFFGLNHWANGKTAIELGTAIVKN